MAAPVKAILAGTALAGVGGTGIGMIYSGSMPEWRPLVKDSEFLDASGTKQPKAEFANKYSADKARFLVGTGADVDKEKPKSNENGWTWAFQNLYKSQESNKFKGGFQDLKQGPKPSTGDTNIKSLQGACDQAYKTDASGSKVKTFDSSTSPQGDEFDENHLGILCSPLGSKPKTVKDQESVTNSKDKQQLDKDDGWKNRLGSNKKTDLLAIYYEGNAKAGDELNRQFQDEKPSPGFFKGEEGKSIKDKCNEAYKQSETGNEDTKPKEDDLYKGCSIKGYKNSSTS